MNLDAVQNMWIWLLKCLQERHHLAISVSQKFNLSLSRQKRGFKVPKFLVRCIIICSYFQAKTITYSKVTLLLPLRHNFIPFQPKTGKNDTWKKFILALSVWHLLDKQKFNLALTSNDLKFGKVDREDQNRGQRSICYLQ